MIGARFHADSHSPGQSGAGGGASNPGRPTDCGGRLNLLLSYAGWQPDPWVNHLPPMLEPMGVSTFLAGTGRDASRVIQSRPIHIAVVDLALPLDATCGDEAPEVSEGGTRILELLARLESPPPTLVIKRARTTRDDCREMAAALKAGAFAVLDRPRQMSDLNLMLGVMERVLNRFYHGRWPARVPPNFA